jgi:hypothetical protein
MIRIIMSGAAIALANLKESHFAGVSTHSTFKDRIVHDTLARSIIKIMLTMKPLCLKVPHNGQLMT